MNDEKTYTTREICRGLEIPERTLIHWADKGLVEPVVDADGLGTRRQYTADNVFEIAIIKALWGRVSNKTIKLALEWLNVKRNKPWEAAFLAIYGEEVQPMRDKDLMTSTKGGVFKRIRGTPIVNENLFNILMRNELTIFLNVYSIRKDVRKFLA